MALAQQSRGMTTHEFEAAASRRARESIWVFKPLKPGSPRPTTKWRKPTSRPTRRIFNCKSGATHRTKRPEHGRTRRFARKLQDHVAEYATLHLAREVLDLAVERYRARHQDSMLARAASFFEQLTDGDFATLEIQNEDGNPVLKAVRADGKRTDAIVSIEGLSDGTRDQLFLALRLAGIERHLAEREPMPLIIDDVLINFDDRRASATLRCIGELSRKTQVLLFTHHRHLVELAKSAVASQLVAHEF